MLSYPRGYLIPGQRVPPRKDIGPVEVLWEGDVIPPGKDMEPVEVLWDGDPHPRVWTDKQTENITSHRTSYTGGNKTEIKNRC